MIEKIPDRQGIALVIFFVTGNAFVFGIGARAGNDLWLAFILGIILAIPLIILNARVRSLTHGKPLGAALDELLGKWPARLVALAYAGYAWRLAAYVTIDISGFIQAISLPKTPTIIVAASFALLALWGAKEGMEVLARWCSVVIKVMFPMIFIALGLLLTDVDLAEFLPVLYGGFKPVFLGALELLDFPFLETIILFWAFDTFKNKNSPYRIFLFGTMQAFFVLFVVSNVAMAVIGTEMYSINYFPIFIAIARIDLFHFITRLEIVVGISYAIGSFIKITVCLIAAGRGIAYGLGFKDYRFLITPLALGLIPGSQWLIKSIMEVEKGATKVIGASDFSFQVIFPLLIWIIVELKVRKTKKSHS